MRHRKPAPDTPARAARGRVPKLLRNAGLLAAVAGLAVLLAAGPRSTGPRNAAPAAGAQALAAVADLEGAALALAEERGRTYLALHLPRPPSTDQRARMDRDHAETHLVLNRAVDALLAAEGPRAAGPAQRIREAAVRAGNLHEAALDALELPRPARDAELPARWLAASTELIESVLTAFGYARLNRMESHPGERERLALQGRVWRLAEIAGRERAVIAAALASGRPLEDAQRTALVAYRNRIEGQWARLERAARESGRLAELGGEFQRVRRVLLQEMAMARDLVVQASARSATYPFTPEQWFSFASRTIEAVVALGRRVDRAAATAGA